jgi:hypothetical protein
MVVIVIISFYHQPLYLPFASKKLQNILQVNIIPNVVWIASMYSMERLTFIGKYKIFNLIFWSKSG